MEGGQGWETRRQNPPMRRVGSGEMGVEGRGGRVSCGAGSGAGSCWSPFPPTFLRRRRSREGGGRGHLPVRAARSVHHLRARHSRPAAAALRLPRRPLLPRSGLRPRPPAVLGTRARGRVCCRDSVRSRLSPPRRCPPQPPGSPHSPPGQVPKFGVRVALLATSLSASLARIRTPPPPPNPDRGL